MTDKPRKITVHHSGGEGTLGGLLNYFKGKYDSDFVPYHVIIDFDGSYYFGLQLTEVGEHCKLNNTGNVGICVLGDYSEGRPTIQQMISLYDLICFLYPHYDMEGVYPHNQLKEDTICPGKYLTMWVEDLFGHVGGMRND